MRVTLENAEELFGASDDGAQLRGQCFVERADGTRVPVKVIRVLPGYGVVYQIEGDHSGKEHLAVARRWQSWPMQANGTMQ